VASDAVRLEADPHSLRLVECPVCQSRKLEPFGTGHKLPLLRCAGCGLVVQSPQPSDDELRQIYGADYFIGSNDEPELQSQFELVKRATARLQLEEISAYLRAHGRNEGGLSLLEIGCGHGNMLLEARARGFDVHGLEFSADAAAVANAKLDGRVQVGSIENNALPAGAFDVCVVADVIEHVREPRRFLDGVRRLLKPRGAIFIATPSLDSWSAKVLGRHWMEYKREHLYYFSRDTMSRLMQAAGFSDVTMSTGRKVLTPGYVIGHFKKFPVPAISPAASLAEKAMPSSLLKSRWTLTASGINVLATKADNPA
jgi:SAM-dependent methyltransferase